MWTAIRTRPWSFSLSGGILLSAALVLKTTKTLSIKLTPFMHSTCWTFYLFIFLHMPKGTWAMKGCLVAPFLCLYMPLHSLLYNIHPRCKIKLPVTKHAIHCNQDVFLFPQSGVRRGVTGRKQTPACGKKSYNSITLQNRQGWFCSLTGCCVEFKVADTFRKKGHNADPW